MSRISTISAEGNWYKGTTHAHTNISDGILSPAELVNLYRKNGYSFMALTDHRVYGVHEDLAFDDFLVLPGVELDTNKAFGSSKTVPYCHHLIGLGIPGANTFKHGQPLPSGTNDVNELTGILREGGNLCIYAHPSWSHIWHEDLDNIDNIFGIEVYNNVCHVNWGCGDSESFFDRLLYKGRKCFCFASDDTHQHTRDYMGGFIWVKAKALTQKDIFDAILSGSFYASNGPQIKDFYIEGSKAFVECSPCRSVSFMSDNTCGFAQNASETPLTHAQYDLRGIESYVRVVCEDETGKKAWSQPIWLK